jgi:hypothetical protein
MSQTPFFHEASGCVRFWVLVDENPIGASVAREALYHRYGGSTRDGSDPLAIWALHVPEMEAAVRRRVAQGSVEPVMLREFDLREAPGPGAG